METLYIITALYRYRGLDLIAESISSIESFFNVVWLPIGGNDNCAVKKRNFALNIISKLPSGWIYHLDDDNIIHETFGRSLCNSISLNPHCKVFLFRQLNYDGSIYLDCPSICRGNIDTGSYVVSTELAKGIMWNYEEFPDFVWIKNVVGNDNECIVVNDGFCYYNALNGISKQISL